MKTIINAIVVMACLCISTGVYCQSYAAKTYKLDPKKKTWMQSIHTFSKSGKWAKPDPMTTTALSAEDSYKQFKGAFPELKNVNEYIGSAYAFKTKKPKGTLKKILKNGQTVQYHDPSKVFAAYNKSGHIITMFRPKEGKTYYDKIGVDKNYNFPGFIKTLTADNKNKPTTSNTIKSGSGGSNSTATSNKAKHTRDYYLKSYRPKPGSTTWLTKASTFGKVSTSKWHAKKSTTAATTAKSKYSKHKGAFPEIKSLVEYISAAHKFRISPPTDALRKNMKNGDLVIYDEKSNVFAAYDKDLLPRTMFRPKAGIQYWDDLDKVRVIQYDGYGESNEANATANNQSANNSSTIANQVSDNNYQDVRTSSIPLVQYALECTKPTSKHFKILNTQKSWDAVKRIIDISQTLPSTEARKINARNKLVFKSDKKVTDFNKITEGSLIGFFEKDILIHLMISSGKGKAIGTGNKIIGIGDLRGWQEIDLTAIRLKNENKFINGTGSGQKEISVVSYNPKDGGLPRRDIDPETGVTSGYGNVPVVMLTADEGRRRLAQIAQDALTPDTPKEKALAFKKSHDAIEDLLVLSDIIDENRAKKMLAIKELIQIDDKKVRRFSQVPEGMVVGFFKKLPNNKSILVHSLITTGDNKAIGTGNMAIGQGKPKGIEEVDLDNIDLGEDATILKKVGSNVTELHVRVADPIELSTTGKFSSSSSNSTATVENGIQEFDTESVNNIEYTKPPEPNLPKYPPPPGLNDNSIEYKELDLSAPTSKFIPAPQDLPAANMDNWSPELGITSQEMAQRWWNQTKTSLPEVQSLEHYVALAEYYYKNPPSGYMRRVLKNGMYITYHHESGILVTHNKNGQPFELGRPSGGEDYFKSISYEATCTQNNPKSNVVDDGDPIRQGLSLGPMKQYPLHKPLLVQYKNENLGTNEKHEKFHVEYCSVQERKHLEVFVYDGKIVDGFGELYDTHGASKAFVGAMPHLAIFAMDINGRIYVFKYPMPGRFHHSSFLSGGSIAAAGEIQIFDGVIEHISLRSGHYQPSIKMMEQLYDELKARGYKQKLPVLDTKF